MTTSCDIIDSAISGMVSKMDSINGKVNGLRRLAQLIERASDPRSLVPDINQLVPLGSIDVQSYENLRTSCPFLNLPSAALGLENLKSDLNKAYNALIAKLKLHPFLQLQRLVDKLDRLLASSGIDLACVNKYLQCARAACVAAGRMSATLEKNTLVVEKYTANVANTSASVLSNSAQTKVKEVTSAIDQIKNLQK